MNIIINRINMCIVTSLKEIKNVCSSLGTQRCSDYSNSYSRLPALGLNFLKFLNQNFRQISQWIMIEHINKQTEK